MSILRHPFAGSGRWAIGILEALGQEAAITTSAFTGHRRLIWANPARKVANWALDRLWYEVELPRLARRQRCDVLFMPVNLVARRSRIPQVVSILDVNFVAAPGTYDRAFERYATRQFARSVRDAERVTTISEFSRRKLAETFAVNEAGIEVIYPGLKAPTAAAGPRPLDRPYALYVGATEPHKNVPLALEAWRRSRDLDIALAIVGKPGRAHQEVMRLAESDPRVVVVGAVDDAMLSRWYQHASVFVFPSIAEGFGFPPLEAMQYGVPVVAARAGPLPEVLGDAACYHAPNSWEELADGVTRLLADSDLRASQIIAGRERAARYTWSASGHKLAELLGSVAGEPA
jgi:glycosyltransferase involved in cell wall biosynthesis